MQTSSGEIKTREFNKPERVHSPQPQRKQSASFSLPMCVPAGKSCTTFIFRWNDGCFSVGLCSRQPVLTGGNSPTSSSRAALVSNSEK